MKIKNRRSMILSMLGPFPVMDLCDAITRFDAKQTAPWGFTGS
jgi:hypothetical protein